MPQPPSRTRSPGSEFFTRNWILTSGVQPLVDGELHRAKREAGYCLRFHAGNSEFRAGTYGHALWSYCGSRWVLAVVDVLSDVSRNRVLLCGCSLEEARYSLRAPGSRATLLTFF